jgi:hypothetical protein
VFYIRIKQVKNYSNYYVSDMGDVYSICHNKFKKLKLWSDGKSRYYMVSLCNGTKHTKKALVHRLVAEAFLSNPNNLPEVNHIDYNCKNNAVSNLEWCTRVYNMQHCFKKHSQVRNYKPCAIYQDGHFIKKFQSIAEASRFATAYLQISGSSLSKYKIVKNYELRYVN